MLETMGLEELRSHDYSKSDVCSKLHSLVKDGYDDLSDGFLDYLGEPDTMTKYGLPLALLRTHYSSQPETFVQVTEPQQSFYKDCSDLFGGREWPSILCEWRGSGKARDGGIVKMGRTHDRNGMPVFLSQVNSYNLYKNSLFETVFEVSETDCLLATAMGREQPFRYITLAPSRLMRTLDKKRREELTLANLGKNFGYHDLESFLRFTMDVNRRYEARRDHRKEAKAYKTMVRLHIIPEDSITPEES